MSGEGVIYLRGVSDETKRTLAQLADASGRSLNRYAITVLEEHARASNIDQPKRRRKRD